MKKQFSLVSVVVALLLLVSSYHFVSRTKYFQSGSSIEEPDAVAKPSTSITEPNLNEGSKVEVKVEGGNFTFSPSEIKVSKGDLVKITFYNAEGFHDLVIDEFNVKTSQIKAGETEVIEFIADRAGVFEYYCSVGKHREMGMVGSLIVE